MPRSGQEARRRLQRAALELYREQGFDRTTSAAIAARAGVSERTFFHHFPDKREVLFAGEDHLRAVLAPAVADAPAEQGPLEVLLGAFGSLGEWMEQGREYACSRQELVAATPALREREAAKLASLADTLSAALRGRGVPARRAHLAAHAGVAAFAVASLAWFDDPTTGFPERLAEAFDDLRVLGDGPGATSS